MGISQFMGADNYPQQGRHLGQRVAVAFHYESSRQFAGTIVRDDVTPPYIGIIKLDSGRYVLMSECQYSVESGQGAS